MGRAWLAEAAKPPNAFGSLILDPILKAAPWVADMPAQAAFARLIPLGHFGEGNPSEDTAQVVIYEANGADLDFTTFKNTCDVGRTRTFGSQAP